MKSAASTAVTIGKTITAVFETGFAWEGEIAVLEGLQDDDQVVVVGQAALKDGSKVRVIGEESSTLATASDKAEIVAGT